MKEKCGKNGASQVRDNKTVFMIVSILAAGFFIGTAMQPAIAGSVPFQVFDPKTTGEECTIYVPKLNGISHSPSCKTCEEAIAYAVSYMKGYVKEKLKDVNDTYFLWRLDVIILISQGIHIGLKKSGFKIEIDEDELKTNVEYWVNKTVGPQMFNVTIILAKLGAISIGVADYLLTLCNGDVAKNSQASPKQIWSISRVMSRFFRWISISRLFAQ